MDFDALVGNPPYAGSTQTSAANRPTSIGTISSRTLLAEPTARPILRPSSCFDPQGWLEVLAC